MRIDQNTLNNMKKYSVLVDWKEKKECMNFWYPQTVPPWYENGKTGNKISTDYSGTTGRYVQLTWFSDTNELIDRYYYWDYTENRWYKDWGSLHLSTYCNGVYIGRDMPVIENCPDGVLSGGAAQPGGGNIWIEGYQDGSYPPVDVFDPSSYRYPAGTPTVYKFPARVQEPMGSVPPDPTEPIPPFPIDMNELAAGKTSKIHDGTETPGSSGGSITAPSASPSIITKPETELPTENETGLNGGPEIETSTIYEGPEITVRDPDGKKETTIVCPCEWGNDIDGNPWVDTDLSPIQSIQM